MVASNNAKGGLKGLAATVGTLFVAVCCVIVFVVSGMWSGVSDLANRIAPGYGGNGTTDVNAVPEAMRGTDATGRSLRSVLDELASTPATGSMTPQQTESLRQALDKLDSQAAGNPAKAAKTESLRQRLRSILNQQQAKQSEGKADTADDGRKTHQDAPKYTDVYGGDWSLAIADLDTLKVVKAEPQGYDRDKRFLSSWGDAEIEGCDAKPNKATTRDLILRRDLTDTKLDKYCRVVSGTLDDPYTGRKIAFTRGKHSADVQIDHRVSLVEAWALGADEWTDEQRNRFANDPAELVASDGPANMEKSGGFDFDAKSDPVWLPSNKAYVCPYLASRVSVKKTYGLGVTEAEKAQTERELQGCIAG